MTKFCWVYKNRTTGLVYLVRRPSRYSMKPMYVIHENKVSIPAEWFRRDYEFVGRRDKVHVWYKL